MWVRKLLYRLRYELPPLNTYADIAVKDVGHRSDGHAGSLCHVQDSRSRFSQSLPLVIPQRLYGSREGVTTHLLLFPGNSASGVPRPSRNRLSPALCPANHVNSSIDIKKGHEVQKDLKAFRKHARIIDIESFVVGESFISCRVGSKSVPVVGHPPSRKVTCQRTFVSYYWRMF